MIGMSSARRQLILLAMLVFPASAEAAPYGTLPFTRLPDGTACVSPTGAPGEILRWTEGGVELLAATADGLRGADGVALGKLHGCPRVASDPSGAAVAAGATARELRVAVREPGAGSFAAPVRLAAIGTVIELDVAVSARGGRRRRLGRAERRVRRACGSGWPAARPVGRSARRRTSSRGASTRRSATSRSGWRRTARRWWSAVSPTGRRTLVMARFGRPGSPLGAPQRLAFGGLLGMGPDGRALVVKANGGGVSVLERPPGSAGFTAPQVFSDTGGPIDPAVAFGADGRAVVAWHEPYAGTVGAVVREPGATGFGAPIVVVPAPRSDSGFGFSLSDDGGPPERPSFQAAIGSDGRVRLAWPRKGGGAATAALAGGAVVERQVLGGRLRGAEGLSLLTLADGRGALAWTNHEDGSEDSPARQHYAVEGAADAPAAGHAADHHRHAAPERAQTR